MSFPVIKIIFRDNELNMSLTEYVAYRVDPTLIEWDEKGYGINSGGQVIHRDNFNVIREASYTLKIEGFFVPVLMKIILKLLMFWYLPAAFIGATIAAREAKRAAEALIIKHKGEIIY